MNPKCETCNGELDSARIEYEHDKDLNVKATTHIWDECCGLSRVDRFIRIPTSIDFIPIKAMITKDGIEIIND